MENKYQITKTIRFKLEPVKNSLINSELIVDAEFSLPNFLCILDDYIEKCNEYLFEMKKGSFVVKDKLKIKSVWLRTFQKQEYADLLAKKKANNDFKRIQTILGDIPNLTTKIEAVIDKIDTIYADLTDDVSAEINNRAKRAKTALLLKRLSTKQALPYLISLIENVTDKNESDDLSIRLKNIGIKLQGQLRVAMQRYLPEQSEGLPIAHASFNYYSINKKPVDYTLKIDELKNLLKFDLDNDKLFQNKEIKEDIRSRLEGKILLIGDSPLIDVDGYVSLRQILKNIKSEQKKGFSEFMQNKHTLQELRNRKDLYLFKDIPQNDFEDYYDITQEIEKKSTELSLCTNNSKKELLIGDLKTIKKIRGSFINAADKSNNKKFVKYKNFADIYRKIAQKHGRILSQLKGVEKERVESQLLNFWAIVVEDNDQHKIILIPRENTYKCKAYVEQSRTLCGSVKLYWFESFTFRSLRKLCFGNIENGTNSNTFYPEISKELCHIYYTKDKYGNNNFIKCEADLKGDEQNKIKFYKDVLKTDYARHTLKLPWNVVDENIINVEFCSLEEFIIALEKICYRRFVVIDKDIINKLSDFNAQIFDIKSLDLDHQFNIQNNSTCYSHNDKNHTKIWKYFWSEENEQNNFDTRLNPEITITYRKPKQSRIDKYGENTTLYDPKKKNRYLNEQYSLISTFSEHSNHHSKDLSFISEKEFEESIDIFNKKMKAEDIKFAFGIDNGEAELSTLGVYLPQFNKGTNEEKILELKKVSEYGFKVLKIKKMDYSEVDINNKEKKVIQNPSYFLNEELYCRTFNQTEDGYNEMLAEAFNEESLLTLDLTTAKVINGKIVTNGDVQTYLNLWLRIAQRKIYDMNDHVSKETAKRIVIKRRDDLEEEEKFIFVTSIYDGTKEYNNLDESQKIAFINWLFKNWDGESLGNPEFEVIKDKQGRDRSTYKKDDIFALAISGTKIIEIKNVFKNRSNFSGLIDLDVVKSEIEKYNTRTISNEELDLKINDLKKSIVANAIGVIDFLYISYKERFKGDGLIVKEGFDTSKVKDDLNNFSGNIYRILERKLYQKFQNYGLVPPIKNLLSVRNDGVKDDKVIFNLGIIGFVSQSGTSQKCPICDKKIGGHKNRMQCECGFSSQGIMHSNDGIAGLNIAKRGFENINKSR